MASPLVFSMPAGPAVYTRLLSRPQLAPKLPRWRDSRPATPPQAGQHNAPSTPPSSRRKAQSPSRASAAVQREGSWASPSKHARRRDARARAQQALRVTGKELDAEMDALMARCGARATAFAQTRSPCDHARI